MSKLYEDYIYKALMNILPKNDKLDDFINKYKVSDKLNKKEFKKLYSKSSAVYIFEEKSLLHIEVEDLEYGWLFYNPKYKNKKTHNKLSRILKSSIPFNDDTYKECYKWKVHNTTFLLFIYEYEEDYVVIELYELTDKLLKKKNNQQHRKFKKYKKFKGTYEFTFSSLFNLDINNIKGG